LKRKNAGYGDRIEVGNRVDHVAVVVGLELQRQDDAVTRQRGRQPAADFHQQVTHRDARHDVQDNAARTHRQVARRQIRPVSELFRGLADRCPGCR
jgi:hypothetical protein